MQKFIKYWPYLRWLFLALCLQAACIAVKRGYFIGIFLILPGIFVIPYAWHVLEKLTKHTISKNCQKFLIVAAFVLASIVSLQVLSFSSEKIHQGYLAQKDEPKQLNSVVNISEPKIDKSPITNVSPSPSEVPKPSLYPSLFDELPNYYKDDDLWHNIAIDPNTSEENLIELARSLHKDFPDWKIRIFNDKNMEMFNKYKEADEHYPDEKNYPYPEEWADKHYVGIINEMTNFETGKKEWQLVLKSQSINL